MAPGGGLGFGCVALSTLPDAAAAQRLLGAVADLGITYFDTAPVYGRGYSERLLGQFLRGKRDRMTVATKFGLGDGAGSAVPAWLALRLNHLRRTLARNARGPGNSRFREPAGLASGSLTPPRSITRGQIQASFEQSLRSLGTDHIDIYLLHEAVPSFLEPEGLEFVRELKASGRVGALGLAAAGRNYLALDPADLSEWDVLQYEFGPAWPETRTLPQRFPDHLHSFHSCLRGAGALSIPGVEVADVPGRVLADCLAAHPQARVLFSSTNVEHIRRNLSQIG